MRIRMELDSAGMMAQMAAIEAQAGGHLAQMMRPVELQMGQTLQSGVNAVHTARQIMSQSFANSQAPFFATGPQAIGYSPTAYASMAGALHMPGGPGQDYRYTALEQQQQHAQNFGRMAEAYGLGTMRAGLSAIGHYSGGMLGFGVGGAMGGMLGAGIGGLFGGIPGMMLGGLGGVAGMMGGLGAGSQMGHELYGPFGGAQIGALAGGLTGFGAMAGGVVGGAAGLGAQAIIEQVAARNQFRPLVEQIGMQAATYGKSDSPMGTGYTNGQVNKITNDLVRTASRDFRYNAEDYGAIIQAGAESGRYDTAHTVERFSATTKDLVESVKLIQTGLRKSLDEALPVLKSAVSMGAGSSAQVRSLVADTRAGSMVTGISPDEALQAGELGQAMTQGIFYRTTGNRMGQQGIYGTRFLRQQGAIRNAAGADRTWETIQAAGGELAVSSASNRSMAEYMQGGEAESLLMGAYNPTTRTLDMNRLKDYTSGSLSTMDMMGAAAGKVSKDINMMARFRRDKEDLVDGLTPGQMAQMEMRGINEVAQMTGQDPEAVYMARARRQGIAPLDARAQYNWKQQQPALERAEARNKAIDSAWAVTDDRLRETGIGGYINRARMAVRGVAADAMADFTSNTWDPLVNGVSRAYDKNILGISPRMGKIPIGIDDILPAAEGTMQPQSDDLRDSGRPGGLLPSLFGPPTMSMSRNEILQKRLSGGAGYIPGYGPLSDGGVGVPVSDNWGPGTRTFNGSMAALQAAEQENSRLANAVASVSGPLIYGQDRDAGAYSAVQRGISSKLGGKMQDYVESGVWSNGSKMPNFTMLAADLAQRLGLDASDPRVRDEAARAAKPFLTEDQVKAMSVSANDALIPQDKVAGALAAAKEAFSGLGIDFDMDKQGGYMARMAGAAQKDFKSGADDIASYLLGESGAGSVGPDGTFRFNKGVDPQTAAKIDSAAKAMATGLTLPDKEKFKGAIKALPDAFLSAQHYAINEGLSNTMYARLTDPALSDIRSDMVGGDLLKNNTRIFSLDQPGYLEDYYQNIHGLGPDEAKKKAEAARAALGKDSTLSALLKGEHAVGSILKGSKGALSNQDKVGLIKALSEETGGAFEFKKAKGLAQAIAAESANGKDALGAAKKLIAGEFGLEHSESAAGEGPSDAAEKALIKSLEAITAVNMALVRPQPGNKDK